ncbi:F-box/kelch-repeat protein At1g57790-like [Camellia sinensis]|uniref:F-box/kelch-repeat protein At1g57790-like n=1 Tax=Camellia sinensis TaxID=4442 RepID=UPI0010368A7A|nr:F-box/kelch-repeat protein At1g57790-like [Camellia sinensis]
MTVTVFHNLGDSNFEIKKLPMDLQKLGAKFVANTNVKDYMSLRSVCRGWRSLTPPIRWRSDPTSLTSIECWLMLFEREKGLWSFCDPMNNSTYYMYSKELLGCEIRFSNDGWLLVTEGLRSVFFFEFFSKTKIKLPDLVEDYCFDGISFSASPISSDWVVFAISHTTSMVVNISYIKTGDENWTSSGHDNGRPFVLSGCNPVFFNQCFYCLGEEGSLGTFRLTGTGGSLLIRVHPQSSQCLQTMSRGFMVSFKKNLFSVFVGPMGKPVHIFQLNSSSTEWVKLTNLGCLLFFFSQTSSLVVPAIGGTLKNKISFPTFASSNNSCIVYSLDNSRFGALGSDCSTEDLYDAKELLGATWLQPRVIGTTA